MTLSLTKDLLFVMSVSPESSNLVALPWHRQAAKCVETVKLAKDD